MDVRVGEGRDGCEGWMRRGEGRDECEGRRGEGWM